MLPRSHAWVRLQDNRFDLLVVGGGASGLGVALEAQLRGLNVALVEGNDYAGGTSGISTKLAHGGLRYLEKAFTQLSVKQYQLVRDALRERDRLLAQFPHLVRPIELLVPVASRYQRLYFGTGLGLYHALAGKSPLPGSQWRNSGQSREVFPWLNPNVCTGTLSVWDGQMNDSLLALELAQRAEAAGAVLLNHAKVLHVAKPVANQVDVQVQDALDPEKHLVVKARAVINCTGPWADVLRLQVRPNTPARLRYSQGIHIVLPLPPGFGHQGLMLPETSDGRVLFALPWQNSLLVGTTDTEVADPSQPPQATEADLAYVLEQANRLLLPKLERHQITGVFAGYRPLVARLGTSKTEALIRDHEVEVWEAERFISLLGGKWTTYRKMAQDAVNAAEKLLKGQRSRSKTRETTIPESPREALPGHWPEALRRHLEQYGTASARIAARMAEEGFRPLAGGYPYDWAEVEWHIEQSQASTVADVLLRRTRLGLENLPEAHKVAPEVARMLAKAHTGSSADALLNEWTRLQEANLKLLQVAEVVPATQDTHTAR